jgi:hypothetical protein
MKAGTDAAMTKLLKKSIDKNIADEMVAIGVSGDMTITICSTLPRTNTDLSNQGSDCL